eukprot:4683278-Prymnesium_polylepis.2
MLPQPCARQCGWGVGSVGSPRVGIGPGRKVGSVGDVDRQNQLHTRPCAAAGPIFRTESETLIVFFRSPSACSAKLTSTYS